MALPTRRDGKHLAFARGRDLAANPHVGKIGDGRHAEQAGRAEGAGGCGDHHDPASAQPATVDRPVDGQVAARPEDLDQRAVLPRRLVPQDDHRGREVRGQPGQDRPQRAEAAAGAHQGDQRGSRLVLVVPRSPVTRRQALALLKARGHNVALKASMGRTQTIQMQGGMLYGYSDPRNPDGKTLGY